MQMEKCIIHLIFYKTSFFSFFIISLFFSFGVHAETFVIQPGSSTIGKITYDHAEYGETLREVGIRNDLGLNEMMLANPNLPSDHILSPQVKITLPTRFQLPKGPWHGIIINLATFRLYYFPPHENVVFTFPVGIGRKGWSTPLGITKIIAKVKDPTWRPSIKLQKEGEKNGLVIPESFPPNESNPLGRYALRLGWSTYLIHGTNSHGGVGERVSAGCIRMLPQDIEYLFEQVKVGTSVRIINEPVSTVG